MEDFQRRKRIRRRLYSPLSLLVVAVLAALFLRGAWQIWQKERESGRNINQVSRALEEARRKERQLSAGIERLQTERGKEEEIREKFSVARTGEEVAVIVERGGAGKQEQGGAQSIWQKIKNWISDLFSTE
ncbi:hypothetical protein EPN83_00085 [Patescibacteria group bacterium]|nr:MAG: hypothetical protein EPN83_00085 [Patescibacteria group bacterium]